MCSNYSFCISAYIFLLSHSQLMCFFICVDYKMLCFTYQKYSTKTTKNDTSQSNRSSLEQ